MKKKILECCLASALLLTSTVYAQQIRIYGVWLPILMGSPCQGW